jgi:hypothetical protein
MLDWVSNEIETGTSLDRLAARGTVRLALREAGLDPAALDARQLAVVLERVLPGKLTSSGVADGEAFCAGLRARMPSQGGRAGGESPEAIFSRLGGATR